jgi:hypothetical protein
MTGGGKSERLANCRIVEGTNSSSSYFLYINERRPGFKMRTDAFVWRRACAKRHTKKTGQRKPVRERGYTCWPSSNSYEKSRRAILAVRPLTRSH